MFNVLSSAAEARLLFLARVGIQRIGNDDERMIVIRQVVLSSRPVAIANLIVARTAVRFGIQSLSSVGVFPPR